MFEDKDSTAPLKFLYRIKNIYQCKNTSKMFKQFNKLFDDGIRNRQWLDHVYDIIATIELTFLWAWTKKKFFFSFFYLFRCPTSYERAQNTRLHR